MELLVTQYQYPVNGAAVLSEISGRVRYDSDRIEGSGQIPP